MNRCGINGRIVVAVLAGCVWATYAAAAETAAAGASTAADHDPHARATALFERYWQESAERFPEWATFRGDHRYDDRLHDASEAGEAADERWQDGLLAEARAIPRAALAPVDRVSLDLFVDGLERDVAQRAFPGWRRMSFGSQFGFQGQLAHLLRAADIRDTVRAEQAITRMAAYPRRVEQEIDRARRAAALGWVQPRPVLQRTLAQIDAQLAQDAAAGPFGEAFARLGGAALRARAIGAIEQHVLPAQRRMRTFVADELLPKAPATGGLSRYPDGAAVYALQVRQHTTTGLTPEQVHALGLRELARIRGEIAEVQRKLGIEGTVPELARRLDAPQYHVESAEALLDRYRVIAKRVDPELPRLFAELPRAPYGVRALPAFLGADASESYDGPAEDGSAPGWFNANAEGWRKRTTWSMPTLVAHEAVPGHHLQSARAQEIGALPAFRRDVFYTAYVEGWALYAETLGREIGLYERPEDLFGHLQGQALRAGRLVVDTGLHAFGWSRQRAIDFLIENTGESPTIVADQVDRYLSWPGQALAYMVGQLKIIELRERARTALGPRFDLRRFHNAVLDQGALPLSVLDRVIDDWIAAERARTTTAAAPPGR
jgi:uncharacterized protein (DUF885 family)